MSDNPFERIELPEPDASAEIQAVEAATEEFTAEPETLEAAGFTTKKPKKKKKAKKKDEAPKEPEAPTATQELVTPEAPKSKNDLPAKEEVLEAVKPYLQAGLEVVELTDTYFHFRKGTREAAGNLACPLGVIINNVRLLMPQDTKAAPE